MKNFLWYGGWRYADGSHQPILQEREDMRELQCESYEKCCELVSAILDPVVEKTEGVLGYIFTVIERS